MDDRRGQPRKQHLSTLRISGNHWNSVHHNTVIWDPGADGEVGVPATTTPRPSLTSSPRTPPDYNSYHVSDKSAAYFLYDVRQRSEQQTQAILQHQAARADVHSTVDTNNTSGYP